MLCHKEILFLFIGMCILPIMSYQKTTKHNNTMLRRKRQTQVDEDRWSWGYAVINSPPPILNSPNRVAQKQSSSQLRSTIRPTNPTTTAPQKATTEYNPCNRPLIQRPSSDGVGDRKSVAKCKQYIWNVRYRVDVAKRSAECIPYLIRENERLMNGVKFAIGGVPANPGEFPHMAAIGWKASVGTWIFKCGGSLISETFVLTAAHCTVVSPVDTTVADVVPKIVRLGSVNIIDKFDNSFAPVDVNISKIVVHPQYRSPKKYFDIALLELQKKVKFQAHVQPACLWTNFDSNVKKAKATGWGVVATGGRSTSPTLQVVTLDMIDSKTCDDLLRPNCNRNWCGIQDHQVCAGILAGGVDACQGDSGGPLQTKIAFKEKLDSSMYYIHGITSFGFSCAIANTPGVYTRVSHFIDWIESVVWP